MSQNADAACPVFDPCVGGEDLVHSWWLLEDPTLSRAEAIARHAEHKLGDAMADIDDMILPVVTIHGSPAVGHDHPHSHHGTS